MNRLTITVHFSRSEFCTEAVWLVRFMYV